MARGVFAWAAAESRRALEEGERRERARASSPPPAPSRSLCLAVYRMRTGRPGRAALGLLRARRCSALYAADQTSALPDGEQAVTDAGDALGDWTYPFMAAMAFLETSIPPVTLVVPGEWAVMLGGAMAGEGQVEILAADRARVGCSPRPATPPPSRSGAGWGARSCSSTARRSGMTEARLARLDDWLDRYGSAAVCLGRLLPLARPLGPFVTGASHFPYRRFLAWNAARHAAVHAAVLRARATCSTAPTTRWPQLLGAARLRGCRLLIVAAAARTGACAAGGVRAAPGRPRRDPRARRRRAGRRDRAHGAADVRAGGGDYVRQGALQNAGQVVKGGLVEIAGKQVGTVTDQRLTDDGVAELTLSIDDEWAPLPRGTHAQIRQFGLSGPGQPLHRAAPAHRRAARRRPRRRRRARHWTTPPRTWTSTTIFSIFDKRTRDSLRGVFRGSGAPVRGPGRERERRGSLYLDPALVSASRLFGELNRDTPKLRALHRRVLGPRGRPGRPPRRPRLAGERTWPTPPSAIAAPARRAGRRHRPAAAVPAPRQHDLREPARHARRPRPAGERVQAGGEASCGPTPRELRRLVQDAEPTIARPGRRDPQAGRAQRPGGARARSRPRLRDIAVGPVERNGAEREGALPGRRRGARRAPRRGSPSPGRTRWTSPAGSTTSPTAATSTRSAASPASAPT